MTDRNAEFARMLNVLCPQKNCDFSESDFSESDYSSSEEEYYEWMAYVDEKELIDDVSEECEALSDEVLNSLREQGNREITCVYGRDKTDVMRAMRYIARNTFPQAYIPTLSTDMSIGEAEYMLQWVLDKCKTTHYNQDIYLFFDLSAGKHKTPGWFELFADFKRCSTQKLKMCVFIKKSNLFDCNKNMWPGEFLELFESC